MRKDLIFDLGLHRGEDSQFYLKKGFSVVAIEADPNLAASAAEEFREYIGRGQLTIVNKAISTEDGPITFYTDERVSVWGTIDAAWADRNRRLGGTVKEISVEGIRFPQLIQQYGVPYYMKIDIEGADLLCLKGLLDCPEKPKFLSIESSKASFEELMEEFCLFQTLGYRKYKIVPQHRIAMQRLPKPPLEGKYVEHTFAEGCSGAFGLELPGDWIPLESSIKQYLGIFRKYRLTGDKGALSNFGVTRNIINSARGDRASWKRMAGRFVRSVGTRLNLRPGWYDTHAMLDE